MPREESDVMVDAIAFDKAGKVHVQGSTAERLLASGFNVNALRTNATLLYDEWKHIDQAVIKAAQDRLVAIAQLMSRGLSYNIPEGLNKTVLGWQDSSDIEDAEVNMDGVSQGRRDRPEYDIAYLPLPIVHKDFSFSVREIGQSRNGNMPLDTTMAELCSMKVSDKVEDILFNGLSSYKFGGGTIYGLTDHPSRNTGTWTADWNDSAATGAGIITDLLAMKQAALNDKKYGPYGLWIPKNFETAVDGDYASGYPKTIRERILSINDFAFMQVADKLTDDYTALVSLHTETIRMVAGLPVTTVQWESSGGMRINFKVMTILIPQIRADQEGNCGVVVYS